MSCQRILSYSSSQEDFTLTHGASLAMQEQGQKQKQVHDEIRKTTGRVAETRASSEAGKKGNREAVSGRKRKRGGHRAREASEADCKQAKRGRVRSNGGPWSSSAVCAVYAVHVVVCVGCVDTSSRW